MSKIYVVQEDPYSFTYFPKMSEACARAREDANGRNETIDVYGVLVRKLPRAQLYAAMLNGDGWWEPCANAGTDRFDIDENLVFTAKPRKRRS
jgi:hypothetical protein